MTEIQQSEVDALAEKISAAYDKLHIEGIPSAYTLSSAEVEALYAAGYQLFRQGDLDRSTTIFNYLCIYEHQDARFWMALAVTLQKQKKLEQAVDAYSAAALLDATNIRPYFHATECLIESRQWSRAEQSLDAFFLVCENFSNDENAGVRQLLDKAEIWRDLIQSKRATQTK